MVKIVLPFVREILHFVQDDNRTGSAMPFCAPHNCHSERSEESLMLRILLSSLFPVRCV